MASEKKQHTISIVIPIYNESENIGQLYKKLTEAFASWEVNQEVLLIDDGSIDDSFELMSNLCESDDRFNVIKLSRNFGHQSAICAGLELAKGDAVVIMDGDLQDPPELVTDFVNKWQEGFKIVYGIREKRKENLFKRICYKSFYRILNYISYIEIPLDTGDFCLMDRRVVNIINNDLPERIRFIRGLRAYAGFPQTGIPYQRPKRFDGEAKYTIRNLFKLALDGFFDFSFFPVRILIFTGLFLFMSSGIGIIFFLFQEKFSAESPVSWLIIGAFFSGFLLLAMGILGEYIARIYFEVKKRPSYIVQEIISKKQD